MSDTTEMGTLVRSTMSAWTIWKFPLPLDTDRFELRMPAAVPLSVQLQNGDPVMWAAVLPETADGGDRNLRTFVWVGTGHPLPDDVRIIDRDYRGTVQLHGGSLVLHLFEVFP